MVYHSWNSSATGTGKERKVKYHTDKVFHAVSVRGGRYMVYTDLTKEQIEEVEGVSTAYAYCTYFSVFLDPRFDADLVMEELQRKAVRQHELDVYGYLPNCGCYYCNERRAKAGACQSEDECKPTITLAYVEPLVKVYPKQCRVYINGEEVTEKTVYKPTEDVAIVPVKTLETICNSLNSINQKGFDIATIRGEMASLVYCATDLLDEVLP